jgi:hypothetical protein
MAEAEGPAPRVALEGRDVACPQCGYSLRDNTSGTCPECGTRFAVRVLPVGDITPRRIRGMLGYIRIVLILLAATPVTLAFVFVLTDFASAQSSPESAVLLPAFGVASLLGLVTLLSVFVARKIHFVVSIVFFGLICVLMIVNIASELISGVQYISVRAALTSYGQMFLNLMVGAAGLVVEIICNRRSKAPIA